MRVVVIGGSGHIGTYLVPRLVRAGHEVVNISRGRSAAYTDAPEWAMVRNLVVDREQQDRDGSFGATVLALRPDVVVDLMSFTVDSTRALVEAVRGHVGHLVVCGSIWRYGPALRSPIREGQGTPATDAYGMQKDEIARYLKDETACGGILTTSIHPGQIVGPGWAPINPIGNRDPAVWETLASGATLRMPEGGTQYLHHVHADDVAQLFVLAIEQREVAAGEDFHAVAPSALNVRGYAETVAGWFGRTASLESVTWDAFRAGTTDAYAAASWGHLHRSHYCSIEKAKALLGFAPVYEPEDAILESVRWLIAAGQLPLSSALVV